MNEVSAVELTFLAPAHVWIKEDGSQSIVLFLTNENLPEKVLAVYPQQVIYLNEEGAVLSQPVEKFCSDRKFLNVDPEIERKVNELLSYSGDDTLSLLDAVVLDEVPATVGNTDEVLVFGQEAEKAIQAVVDAQPIEITTGTTLRTPGSDILIFQNIENQNIDTVFNLERCVTGVRQVPELSENLVLHIVTFDAASLSSYGYSRDTLVTAFDPKIEESQGNDPMLGAFYVPGWGVQIDWQFYVGVYIENTENGMSYNVYLAIKDAQPVENIDQEIANLMPVADAAQTTETEVVIDIPTAPQAAAKQEETVVVLTEAKPVDGQVQVQQ